MTFQQFPTSSSSSSSQTINPIIRERPKTQQQLQTEQDELSSEDRLAEPLSPRSQRLQNTFRNGRENEEREERKRPPPFNLEQTPQQKIDELLTEIESPKHQSPIDSPVRFAPGQEFNRQVYAFGSPVAHPPPIEIRQRGYSQLDPDNVEFFTLVDVAKKLRKSKRYNDLFANARLPVKPTKPTDAYRDKFISVIQGFNDTDKL